MEKKLSDVLSTGPALSILSLCWPVFAEREACVWLSQLPKQVGFRILCPVGIEALTAITPRTLCSYTTLLLHPVSCTITRRLSTQDEAANSTANFFPSSNRV